MLCVWETVSTDLHVALGVDEAIRGIPGRITEIDIAFPEGIPNITISVHQEASTGSYQSVSARRLSLSL